ncbi:MAG TPA: putative ABC transporter permease [Candidatus Ventricola gallistercoris]|nr:putative ABC transporter permease [Candidatus Ventricola gallistercoris]
MIGCLAEESNFIDELETRLKEIERVNKRRFHLLPPAPTNGQIDFEEKRARHFAQGKSFYKLFWVFFIGCFLGVIIERLWCFVRFGVFEPRVGLIYGPFNLVYGVGAWALTMALYQFRNRSKLFSFIGGALVGSVVEYTCSWFQETVFGSVSWDYSNQPFNLNGRICLLYSIYWGLLGILWIKEIYPRMARLILRIPDRIGKPLTFVLAIFMVFNSVMTGLTALRWVNRRQGEPPRNAIEAYFDEHYPDERMQRIFSNLEFTQDDAAPVQENGK